jgi:undecaprenyl-phosphate 4-deoxy-4-formamido-L-arabinose transferase
MEPLCGPGPRPDGAAEHAGPQANGRGEAPRRPELSIVVPVYRSEDCLRELIAAIAAALAPTGRTYEVVLVNDCSPDGSWGVIASLCRDYPNVVGVDLRRNFGQDNAILTGLRLARGDYVAIMDDDLQHDPRHLPALLKQLEQEEADVIYARFAIKHHALWKNLGSWFNGKVAEWVLNKPRGVYLSPYKLLRREVAELVCEYDGPYPYVDGLLFQVTARIAQLPVEHRARFAGRGNFTFWQSVAIWSRLSVGFSVKPLRVVMALGFLLAAAGLLLAVGVVCYKLFFPEHFPPNTAGWASLMVAVLVTSGVQMIFLGVQGEYVGRTYLKVNRKPQATVRRVLNAAACAEPAPGRAP